MDFELAMCLRATTQGWGYSSSYFILLRYLARCQEAMCIPNPEDFDAYLAECQRNEDS